MDLAFLCNPFLIQNLHIVLIPFTHLDCATASCRNLRYWLFFFYLKTNTFATCNNETRHIRGKYQQLVPFPSYRYFWEELPKFSHWCWNLLPTAQNLEIKGICFWSCLSKKKIELKREYVPNYDVTPHVLGAWANIKEKGERPKEQCKFLLSDLLRYEQRFTAFMD